MRGRIGRFGQVRTTLALAGTLALVVGLLNETRTSGQVIYRSGQNIAAAFDGWEVNPDGTYSLVFGNFNRNWDEEFDIPVGPDNNVEPGGPDQGQPTHFLPRRNRFVFRVKVPND